MRKGFLIPLIMISLLAGTSSLRAEGVPDRNLPDYTLEISCNVKENLLKGHAVIIFSDEGRRAIDLKGLSVISVVFNGSTYSKESLIKSGGMLTLTGKGKLIMDYEADFKAGPEEAQNLQNAGVVSQNLLSEKGVALTGGGWYPGIEGLAFYHLSAVVPTGFKAVSEAEDITETNTPEGARFIFGFPHPLEGVDLIAAPYVVQVKKYGETEVYSYFLPEDSTLAEDYLARTQGYLDLYRSMLSPYPYKRFSIVENILPTGYSMPTFTLLGQDVVRLPFITETSLGHEILHQWFGNSVYGDMEKGNWLEGLTTYLADQLYQEQKGTGWEYRKKALIDYRAYVTPDKESPLKDFKGRMDFASRAIGYGKSSMVFDMLKREVGEETFFKALKKLISDKKFQEASWLDIEKEFEDASGKDLKWFFNEWLERKDVPSFEITYSRTVFADDARKVTFELTQKAEPYRFLLPVRIVTDKGEKKIDVEIVKKYESVSIPVDLKEKPLSIYLDEDYHLMRRISYKEFPPVISRLLGAEKKFLVYSDSEKEKYAGLIRIFQSEGFIPKEEKEIKDEDIRSASLLVLGVKSKVLERLFGKFESPGPGFSITVRKNPLNFNNVVASVEADSAEEVELAARKIFHYGGYSSLRFEKGKNIVKEIEPADRGIRINLYQRVPAVVPKDTLTLEGLLPGAVQKPLVFIGERHENYEDHLVELQVIEEMARTGKKFAIGMEMFQKPFQQSLDDYLSGKTNEREFLKASEYFKRWGFDYQLYRDLINFAKAWKVPVIALNMKQEIIKKVAQGGLDSLSESERKEIPPDMDMSDSAYIERLRNVFVMHREELNMNFGNFYQSQILWDETMAHSIAEFFQKNPDSQMVVLAGAQHIAFGSGIPKRAYRLTGRDYSILVNGESENLKDIGDFVLFPPAAEIPAAPRLGIQVKEEKKRVEIVNLEPGGTAEKAGVKKGDILLEVDNWPISSIYDVKIALFDKKQGDTFKLQVQRKRFLRSAKTLELTVTIR